MPAPRDNAARVRILRTVSADRQEFARLSQQRRTSPWARAEAERTSDAPPADRLAALRDEAAARFELELSDMHATLVAMTACCEQSLSRLRDARWISFEAASTLVNDLSAACERERGRAEQLSSDLTSTTRELEEARQECRLAREEAQEAAAQARAAAAAELREELTAARSLAEAATAAEARLREELVAVRTRNQEIIDAQMLRLAEFKRELELASAEGGRARPATAESAPFMLPDPPAQSALEALRNTNLERNQATPQFDAIEAVLAGSPPVAAWQGLDS